MVYSYKYPHPAVSADCIVFAKGEDSTKILLIQRKNPPCEGKWAFPGGFMNIDETTRNAAARELNEETGMNVDPGSLVQIGAYDAVDRDPRERVLTVAYYCIIDKIVEVKGADDAACARWFDINSLPDLAFDHQEILDKAISMAL